MTNALTQRLDALGTESDGAWTLARRQDVARAVLRPLLDYPDQMAVVQALSPLNENVQNVAVFGTRRSGKTEVLARMCLACMLLYDHWVVRMLTDVLHAPTENILDRKSDGGILRLLRDHGLVRPIATVTRVGKHSVVEISFPWGSSWLVHDIGSVRAIHNKHGFTANLYWIDEATKTPLLELAIDQLIAPTLGDHNAPIVLSYTPDEEMDTLPARIAQMPANNWRRHHMAQWRNPFYGATFAARWTRIVHQIFERAQVSYGLSDDDLARLSALSEAECNAISTNTESDALRLWVDGDKAKGTEGLDPELLRNVFGRWVRYGARYVYHFHRVAPSKLYYCAMSETWDESGTLPVVSVHARPTTTQRRAAMAARLALLPAYPIAGGAYEWHATIASDVGTSPDPWTAIVKVWSAEHSIAYELESRKEHDMDDDAMYQAIVDLCDDVMAIGLPIYRVVADLSGMRKGTQILWDKRIKDRYPRLREIGVRAAAKREKSPRIKVHNIDIKAGRYRYIAGGLLDREARNLRYKPDKPAEIDKQREVRMLDGKREVPGDHLLDADLYAADVIPILRSVEPDVKAAKRLDLYQRRIDTRRRR